MIRVFVGSDPQQSVAEKALEASIRANTSQPVELVFMRYGEPGWDWGGLAVGWATPFSMFRWAVPEAAGYKGRAIYVDCDMLALADLTELWEWPLPEDAAGAYAGKMASKADVILWQCWNVPPWDNPAFDGRQSYARKEGAKLLAPHKLPAEWDHVDKLTPETKILHFSKLSLQFWKPYPSRFTYDKPHPDAAAVDLFWRYVGTPPVLAP